MRFSSTFIPTLRDVPRHAEVASHIALLRGGFIRSLGSGLYTWLPLGLRVVQKIERIVREELTARGAQEILMPFVQPGELWKESGRWIDMGPEMLRVVDRHENDYCLSPTHEEVITELFRTNFNSYRQLPCNLFQINTKFRDEIRPRFGVMRSREFIMKDGYSFHVDEISLNETYQLMYDAYSAILTRLGVEFRAVEADPGVIGDGQSHEFHVLAESGEDALAFSSNSDYAANVESAEAVAIGVLQSPSQSMEKVATPNVRTIDQVVDFLGVSIERTLKTLIVRGEDGPVALILRGDHELNELKASRLPGVHRDFQFVSDDEIETNVGCSAGSIGPVGLKLLTYVDRSAATVSDFVCGANENDFHLTGVNWNQVVSESKVVDIRLVEEGDPAPDGSGTLLFQRGIEVGHIFKLGTKYSESMNATVLNEDGKQLVPHMGCYGVGITRLAAAVIEQRHDEQGPDWPAEVAPADVHLISLGADRSADVNRTSEQLYKVFSSSGLSVLYDDRAERPGVKFADADLIGIPHRVIVGERGLSQGGVEYRYRRGEAQQVKLSEIAQLVSEA